VVIKLFLLIGDFSTAPLPAVHYGFHHALDSFLVSSRKGSTDKLLPKYRTSIKEHNFFSWWDLVMSA
jgi:hypothetical protein